MPGGGQRVQFRFPDAFEGAGASGPCHCFPQSFERMRALSRPDPPRKRLA